MEGGLAALEITRMSYILLVKDIKTVNLTFFTENLLEGPTGPFKRLKKYSLFLFQEFV